MKKINKVLVFLTPPLLTVPLYSLIKGVVSFYRGYHNLDVAQNFIQLGYSQDINMAGQLINLKDYYLIGLNQMTTGFGWTLFSVISFFLFGMYIGVIKKWDSKK